ncbi:hypothetical protein [Duganella sp. FT27W]|uniref:hypothetical protein n=1 Tax=Duganella sp. FT27W TaxID=2654636 RepID=UPI001D04F8A8|nr:hypothetical protein [Duganella sp. FT27W]
MATKKIALTPSPLHKPAAKTGAPSADHWVKTRSLDVEKEPQKRLTLDIPASLHARIKSQCALDGTKMVEEIKLLLEDRWPEKK